MPCPGLPIRALRSALLLLAFAGPLALIRPVSAEPSLRRGAAATGAGQEVAAPAVPVGQEVVAVQQAAAAGQQAAAAGQEAELPGQAAELAGEAVAAPPIASNASALFEVAGSGNDVSVADRQRCKGALLFALGENRLSEDAIRLDVHATNNASVARLTFQASDLVTLRKGLEVTYTRSLETQGDHRSSSAEFPAAQLNIRCPEFYKEKRDMYGASFVWSMYRVINEFENGKEYTFTWLRD